MQPREAYFFLQKLMAFQVKTGKIGPDFISISISDEFHTPTVMSVLVMHARTLLVARLCFLTLIE